MEKNRFKLPKFCLLRKTREFDRVYRQGRRLHGKGFSLIFAANSVEYNRLGISVQKKTGNAVERNRVKRIIREAFRTHRERFPLQSDIVLAVRPGFPLQTPAEFMISVNGLMRKAGQSN